MLRNLPLMKECLQCQIEYEPKRLSSKFCSTNCRVKYNRKNGNKDVVGKVQLQVLYNSILGLLEKIEKVAPDLHKEIKERHYSNKIISSVNSGFPKRTIIRTFENFHQLKIDCENQEDWDLLKEEILESNLSQKQKNLLLTS